MIQIKKPVFILFILLFCFSVFAQDRVLHGIVNTFDSIPLIGADIKVKSTKQTVKTDSLGKFTAICNLSDKIKISAYGFYTQNIKVPDNIKIVAINMKLKPGEKQRKYAIGYGYVSEQDLTNAITNLKDSDSDFSRYSNMYDLIRGMGIEVNSRKEIIVRGSKSFQGSSAALIVIDGVISDSGILDSLNPIDVSSVDIIRDGTSSIYGSRGANGVVIVNTKKGNL